MPFCAGGRPDERAAGLGGRADLQRGRRRRTASSAGSAEVLAGSRSGTSWCWSTTARPTTRGSRIVDQSLLDERVRGIQLSRNFGKERPSWPGWSTRPATRSWSSTPTCNTRRPPSRRCCGAGATARTWSRRSSATAPVSRAATGWRAKLFNATFTRLTTVDLVNATDFRLLSRPAVDALLSLPEHASFFRGTSSWIGFRRAIVEVDIDHRAGGASRWTVRSLFRLAVNGLTSFTSAPLHLVTLGGLAFAAFSVVLGVQTLVRWMRGGSVAGFPTVILLLLVMGTFILLGLGIIGEYLARIHEEVRGRPRYLVQERSGGARRGRRDRRVGARTAVPEQWTDRAER